MTTYNISTVLENLQRILEELPEETTQTWLELLMLQAELLEELMAKECRAEYPPF